MDRDQEQDRDLVLVLDASVLVLEAPSSFRARRHTKELALAVSLLVFGALAILAGAAMAYTRVGGGRSDGVWFALIGAVLVVPGFYYTRIAFWAYKGYPGFSLADIPEC